MSSKQKLVRRIVFVSGMNGWSIAGMGVLGGLFSLLTGGWLGGVMFSDNRCGLDGAQGTH